MDVRARRFLITASITIGAAIGGVTLAPMARAECGGGGWSQSGCTRMGGSPTSFGYCSRGSGDCYECHYDCHTGGGENCAEHEDGSGQSCIPGSAIDNQNY